MMISSLSQPPRVLYEQTQLSVELLDILCFYSTWRPNLWINSVSSPCLAAQLTVDSWNPTSGEFNRNPETRALGSDAVNNEPLVCFKFTWSPNLRLTAEQLTAERLTAERLTAGDAKNNAKNDASDNKQPHTLNIKSKVVTFKSTWKWRHRGENKQQWWAV